MIRGNLMRFQASVGSLVWPAITPRAGVPFRLIAENLDTGVAATLGNGADLAAPVTSTTAHLATGIVIEGYGLNFIGQLDGVAPVRLATGVTVEPGDWLEVNTTGEFVVGKRARALARAVEYAEQAVTPMVLAALHMPRGGSAGLVRVSDGAARNGAGYNTYALDLSNYYDGGGVVVATPGGPVLANSIVCGLSHDSGKVGTILTPQNQAAYDAGLYPGGPGSTATLVYARNAVGSGVTLVFNVLHLF